MQSFYVFLIKTLIENIKIDAVAGKTAYKTVGNLFARKELNRLFGKYFFDVGQISVIKGNKYRVLKLSDALGDFN